MLLADLKESAFVGCENEESSSKPYTKDMKGKTKKKKFPGEENCSGNKPNKSCEDVTK
jgi:hypothetical protein